MGRPKVSPNENPAPERHQDVLAAGLNEARAAAERPAKENEVLKRGLERRYELLCSERAALKFDLQKLRQWLDVLELEREVKTRLVQQQAAKIARMSHELAARNTDAELVQKLIQSASWRITAPLRAAKLILTRLMPNRRL
jgi:hypothetical protein